MALIHSHRLNSSFNAKAKHSIGNRTDVVFFFKHIQTLNKTYKMNEKRRNVPIIDEWCTSKYDLW